MSLRKLLTYLSLIALVFVTYANVYQNQFLYDDEFLIQKNANLADWTGLTKSFLMSSTGGSGGVDSFYRPLQGAAYTVIEQLFGESPAGFHFLNILLHALNAILLFTLAERLRFSKTAAWWAALLWCAHPVHTEAITYQSGTADPLCTAFVLTGLIFLVPRFAWTGILSAGFFFILAILSKESGIVFPALAVVCGFLLIEGKKRWSPRSYFYSLPFWLIAFAYLIARKTFLNFDHTFEFYKTANIYTENWIYRLFTFLATLPNYLKLLFDPENLHMDRNFPVFVDFFSPPVLLGAALILLAVVQARFELKKDKLLWSFAALWFFAAHVPNSGVILPVNAFFLEHWLYLPSIGFFMALGQTLSTFTERKPYATLAVGGLAVFTLAGLTFHQNRIWADPITFYTHILQFEPKAARIQNNLAMAYSDEGKLDLSIVHYLEAIRLSDTYPQTHHNLALVYLKQNRYLEGIQQLKAALQLNPDFYQSSYTLMQIYEMKGDLTQAEFYRKQYQASVNRLKEGTLQ